MNPDAKRGPRRHFNYSNVMSTLAVFLVVAGGTALAAALPKNSVRSKSVKDNSLKSKDLKDGKAVGGADLIVDQVQLRVDETCPTGQSIRVINVDGGVICEADDEGTAGGPPNGPAGGDLTGDYPNPQIAAGSVGTSEVTNESLTKDDLLDNSISGVDIEDGTLGGADVANNNLTGADISESSLGQVPAATLGGLGRSASGAPLCDPEDSTLVVCASVDLNLPQQTRALVIGQIQAEEEVAEDDGSGSCELGTNVLDLPSTSTRIETGEDSFGQQTDNTTLVAVTPLLGPGTISYRIRCNQSAGAIVYQESEIAVVALSPS